MFQRIVSVWYSVCERIRLIAVDKNQSRVLWDSTAQSNLIFNAKQIIEVIIVIRKCVNRYRDARHLEAINRLLPFLQLSRRCKIVMTCTGAFGTR